MNSKDGADLIALASRSGDSNFRAKFVDLPHYLDLWLGDHGGLAGKRIMDFGCGEGVTTASVALTRAPSLVVGTDINDEYTACLPELKKQLPVESLPSNLVFERVMPGALPSQSNFDMIYSWSVFEHIDHDLFDDLVEQLRGKLTDDGHLFIQIAPLYYSSEGAHLTRYGLTNWEHLTLQMNRLHDRVFGAEGVDLATKESEWNCFVTLNRTIADEVVETVVRAGFELTRLYKTTEEKAPPARIARVYSNDVLTTNQMVALFRKVPV